MAPLPQAAKAVIDLRKIEDYCLSPTHPRGRHKARVFREVFGFGQNDAEWLRQALLDRLPQSEALQLASDNFGLRFRVDIGLERQGRRGVIRTIWIIQSGETMPRFVTCWVV
jgi:hypothetical protein